MTLGFIFLILLLAYSSSGLPKLKDHETLFEGDMILPVATVKEAITTGKMNPKRKKAKDSNEPLAEGITAPLYMKWKGGVVPYYIDPKLHCSGVGCYFWGAKKEIYKAMKIWSKKTCIQFRRKTATDRDWVHFKDSKWGHCAAHVGRVGGEQFVYLGRFCRKTGIVLHEIGHALGFFHEQSRPDRDKYVKINVKNIKKGMAHNFRKYTNGMISNMNTPYDYDSIMHYGEKEFNKWWFKTIEPKVKGKKIGQRKYLSYWDVKEMNRYYNCPKKN